MKIRNPRLGSMKDELLKKSWEAVLAAVQTFNNPNITFKAESYVVLMIIGWTYLLHAYYKDKHIEYRHFKQKGKRKVFNKTKIGAHKYWGLETCLKNQDSPIDKDTTNNLQFLIGLRHEIEHQMTPNIDDSLSAKFQACCLNFNESIKKLFGNKYRIDKHLSFSLQFSTIDTEQKDILLEHTELPATIQSYVQDFEQQLSDGEYSSPKYAYRILFVRKTANQKGQADSVIEFVPSDSPQAKKVNKEYAVIKETEKNKFLPSQIVKEMQSEGYKKFKMHQHTLLWKEMKAKEPNKGFGTKVADKWYWYESWVDEVRKYCKEKY